MKQKLVLIGNGMAGLRTLEELLKINAELYDISVFGSEPHPNYNRIMLSPVLAGEKTIDDILNLTIDDAVTFFTENLAVKIAQKLKPLQDVGL